MKKMQKGFTLIELLVVIAIIGILSSVVITSMSGARTKANTAAFKAEISSIRPALITACDEGNIVAGTTPATLAAGKHLQGVVATSPAQSCGISGAGTFSVSFAAGTGTTAATVGGCASATVTETTITFTPASGGTC